MAAPDGAARRPALLIALAVLLFAEAALMIVVVAWLLLQLVSAGPRSIASGVAILVLAVIGALWVLLAGFGAARRRSWMRGAAVSWQLVQAAVAIGCFQGLYAEPALGWALLIPALVCVALVVSPAVTRATRREARVDAETTDLQD
ncbi:MAG: hypothetical protein EPN48_12795 [Microbacteriaceae bacterium]|nr:MAG: hypothetical protein EPN48_12795 [Microbacteriaceae bacterium]